MGELGTLLIDIKALIDGMVGRIRNDMATQKAEFLLYLSDQKSEILNEIGEIRSHLMSEVQDIRSQISANKKKCNDLDIRVQQLSDKVEAMKEPDFNTSVYIKNLEMKENETELEIMNAVKELFTAVDYVLPETAKVDRLKLKETKSVSCTRNALHRPSPVKVDLGMKEEVDDLMMKKPALLKSPKFSSVYIERHRPYRDRKLEANMRRIAKTVAGLEYRGGMLWVKGN